MKDKRVLICDDEKNIRLTLSTALEPLELEVETAVNGEDALQRIAGRRFDLILLDLKMPGIDGLEVIRRLETFSHRPQVIVLTAHGTVDSAVEAMKLGAVDFIRKPCTPTEIREAVTRALGGGPGPQEAPAAGYDELIARAVRLIRHDQNPEAQDCARQALYLDPQRPEALHLLGVLRELRGDKLGALKFYRSALDLDGSYRPALANLERVSSSNVKSGIDLGDQPAEKR